MIGKRYSNFTQSSAWVTGCSGGIDDGARLYGTPSTRRQMGVLRQIVLRPESAVRTTFIDLMWSEAVRPAAAPEFTKEKSDSKEAMNIAAGMEHLRADVLKAAKSYTSGRNRTAMATSASLADRFSNANMLIKREARSKNVLCSTAAATTRGGQGGDVAHLSRTKRLEYEPRGIHHTWDAAIPRRRMAAAATRAKSRWQQRRDASSPSSTADRSSARGHWGIARSLPIPHNPKMKEILNSRVKHREWYRPSRPIVLSEKRDWFDIDFETKLMLFIAPIPSAG
jgi:hypothetical protein